ncbi:hypothetical protein [Bacillus sp. AFS017336]|uniref:hypothetical protein n=1 Tax=Bacillus sp. AFS017336 TaxID=2033489 RepID=UPI0015CF7131|nr:hypothetical protein [Bacillus sp. AFS017336]
MDSLFGGYGYLLYMAFFLQEETEERRKKNLLKLTGALVEQQDRLYSRFFLLNKMAV